MTSTASGSGPLLLPLRDGAFAILWWGLALAFLAQWMTPVAAQWYLLSIPDGAPIVPLVQVALTLPMALLALPAGVLADNLDRRRILLTVQTMVLVCEVVLAVLAFSGRLHPLALLTLLAILACGMVMTTTSGTSMIPDLVDRDAIPSAAALLTIATSSTRVAGPAIAGFVIALWGVGWAFAATVPPTLLLLASVFLWKPRPAQRVAPERMISAAWSGIWFVRHSPQALKAMVRGLMLTAGLMGMFSLLPLLAEDAGAGSARLGLLLAAQGTGAVLGALTISLLRRRSGPNTVVAFGFIAAGIASVIAACFGRLVVLGLAVTLAGWAWATVLATLHAVVQVYLPGWIRGRGVAMFLGATYVGQSLGALVLGWIAIEASLKWALAAGVVVLAAGASLALAWPLKDLDHLDRSPVSGWASPELSVNPREQGGQVQVRVNYSIPARSHTTFLTIMNRLRRIRLRTGAIRWQLLQDAELPDHFIEEFTLGSWADYEHQMRDRSVASDRALEGEAARLSVRPPRIRYVLRVDTVKPHD